MLLAGCSTVCTTVAEAAKMWNLVVVLYFILFYLITFIYPLKIKNIFLCVCVLDLSLF